MQCNTHNAQAKEAPSPGCLMQGKMAAQDDSSWQRWVPTRPACGPGGTSLHPERKHLGFDAAQLAGRGSRRWGQRCETDMALPGPSAAAFKPPSGFRTVVTVTVQACWETTVYSLSRNIKVWKPPQILN